MLVLSIPCAVGRPILQDRDGNAFARGSSARATVSVCLDSWAVLAWLDGEKPALSRIEGLLGSRPVVSWVNLVEVYYRVERDHGRVAADDTLGHSEPRSHQISPVRRE